MSSANVVTGIVGFALTVLARILVAVLTTIVVKVFFWYGMGTQKHPNISSHSLFWGALLSSISCDKKIVLTTKRDTVT